VTISERYITLSSRVQYFIRIFYMCKAAG
jgi:hypothetical protein